MKNYNLLSMLGLGIILFGSWGCAKDQTVAEYDNAQAAKQAAQNLPAVALWVGPITSSDGSTVGMIQLNLQNQSQVETAPDNTTTQMTVLGGQAELTNVPNSNAQVTEGHFNPNSDNSNNGTITATITAKDASGNAQTLLLSGTISGNTMTGQVQAGADTPLNFVATKGAAPSTQNLVITSKRAEFANQSYFSTLAPVSMSGDVCAIFNVGPIDATCEARAGCPSPTPALEAAASTTCGSNIEMAIIENNPDGEVNFFNVFTDQPTVQIDLNYYVPFSKGIQTVLNIDQKISGDDLFIQTHLQFNAVTLDLDANPNQLSGTGTTATGTSRINCSATSTANGQGWSCNINNGGTNLPAGVVFGPGQLPADQK